MPSHPGKIKSSHNSDHEGAKRHAFLTNPFNNGPYLSKIGELQRQGMDYQSATIETASSMPIVNDKQRVHNATIKQNNIS